MGKSIAIAVIGGLAALMAADRAAFAQAGSVGGTIGKTDKSISGGEESSGPANQGQQPSSKSHGSRSDEKSAVTEPGTKRIIGDWSGTYKCSGGGAPTGTLHHKVSRDDGGRLVAVEQYTRGINAGTVTYRLEPTSNPLAYKLRSQSTYAYEVNLRYSQDFKSATGVYVGHASCQTMVLIKD